jgi:hypothetical protein
MVNCMKNRSIWSCVDWWKAEGGRMMNRESPRVASLCCRYVYSSQECIRLSLYRAKYNQRTRGSSSDGANIYNRHVMVANTTVGILMTILFECSFLLHLIARPASLSPDNNLRSSISPLSPPLGISSDLRYIARLTQLAFDNTAHLRYVLTATSADAWCSVRDSLKWVQVARQTV